MKGVTSVSSTESESAEVSREARTTLALVKVILNKVFCPN